MKAGPRSIDLSVLQHKDWLRCEMRVHLNQKKVVQYAKEKKQGAIFPPPVVFFDAGGRHWVGDGFHRIEAEKANGQTSIIIDLRPGSTKDAILWNLKANRESQGMLFQPGDITKSVKTLLLDKQFARMTRKAISEACGCTYGLVSKVAKNIGLPPVGPGRAGHPQALTDQVVELLASGISRENVAKELNISVRTTYRKEVASQFKPCPHCHGTGKVRK